MGQKMMQTEKEACQLNQGAVHIDSYWKGICTVLQFECGFGGQLILRNRVYSTSEIQFI